MSIEICSKWVKDGEVVEVRYHGTAYSDSVQFLGMCVCFAGKCGSLGILTERDFIEQYKPYEPVYEYEYRLEYETGDRGETSHMTDDEFRVRLNECDIKFYQRLDFTKRERT